MKILHFEVSLTLEHNTGTKKTYNVKRDFDLDLCDITKVKDAVNKSCNNLTELIDITNEQ